MPKQKIRKLKNLKVACRKYWWEEWDLGLWNLTGFNGSCRKTHVETEIFVKRM